MLYDLLPGIYQQQDQLNGNVLKTWMQSLEYSYNLFQTLIQSWSNLRDPLKVRTAYDEVTTITLGPVVTPPAPIEQRGFDGSIAIPAIPAPPPTPAFISPTARFQQSDVGNKLTIFDSSIEINNRTFTISSIIAPTIVLVNPPLVADPGPLTWQVQGPSPLPPGVMAIQVKAGDVSAVAPGWVLSDGFSQFTIYERQQFFPVVGQSTSGGNTQQSAKLTVEDGTQGQVLADGRFQAETAFAQVNVGQPFSVSGSVATIANSDFTNNGKYEIYAVDLVNPAILTFHAPLTIQGILITGALDPNSAVIYTMTNGNQGIEVQQLVYGPNSLLFVIVSGNQINVYLASDVNSQPTSTAAQVAAAVNAFPAAAALVTTAFGGTGASTAVISNGFLTVPGTRLIPDPGPLGWSLLPFPQIQITSASPPAGITTQEGVDLVLVGSTATSTTANWSSADIGNILDVLGSTIGNNLTFTITGVVNTTQVTISPPAEPSGTTASITSFTTPLLTLTGLSGITPSMVGRFMNISGAAAAGNNSPLLGFEIITYFSPTSVAVNDPAGSAPDANNGSISWGLVDNSLTWQEHTLSGVGFGMTVQLNAPSMIDFLAQDFGITIDDQESESRQRSWVANVTQWIGLKGTAKGYEIIGAISGFNVAVSALFRVTQLVASGLPDTSLYIVGDTNPGRSGLDGSLTAGLGGIIFTAPSALFLPSDIGLNIQTGNCATLTNNGLYTIYEYISPTSVVFAPYNSAVTPDYGLGGSPSSPMIQWEVCRIYTTQVPFRPLFDQVNPELMQQIVGVSNFLVDNYCGADVTSFPINILSVSTAPTSGVPVFYDIVAEGVLVAPGIYSSLGVVLVAGPWEITDSLGQKFFIEPPASPIGMLTVGTGNAQLNFEARVVGNTNITITIVASFALSVSVFVEAITINIAPTSTASAVAAAVAAFPAANNLVSVTVGGNGSGIVSPLATTALIGGNVPVLLISVGPPSVYSFRVFTSQVPATGSATLTYNCPVVLSCNYCQASAVLCLITEGTIAGESGLAIENVFERVLLRLEQEVTPAHVRLVPVFDNIIVVAPLNITVIIIADIEIYSVLLVPAQPYFDILPGDSFSPDETPVAEGGGNATVSAFASPTATITGLAGMVPGVVGCTLFFAGANSPGNNGRFIITAYISATSVQIRNPGAVAPDTNNGNIEWGLETTGLVATITTP